MASRVDDVKKDIAFVRKEKKEDDAIAKKLEEVYGKVSAARDNGYRRSKKGWECPSCGYVNYESRLACGECLDVHPAVAEGTQFQKRKGAGSSNKSDTSSSIGVALSSFSGSSGTAQGSSSACEQFLKRLPNIKEPGESFDKFAKILQISDRCYRVADFPSAAVALGKKKAVKAYYSTLTNPYGNDDEALKKGGGGAAEEDANDDGPEDCGAEFGSCASDEELGDGEPRCVPYARGGEEVLDDYGDDEEENADAPSSSAAHHANTNTAGVTIKMDPESGEYVARMYVSPLLYGFIIGKKGAALAETQRITNTIIKVPKTGGSSSSNPSSATAATTTSNEDEIIIIRGADRAAVTAAVVRIESIVLENRARVGYTHFLSIPLGKDEKFRSSAEAQISKMKSELIAKNPTAAQTERIDESLFQDASWMHFTIIMLRLHTHRELELAKKLLHTEVAKAAAEIFGPPSSSNVSQTRRAISLKGLDTMNDDPSEVDVLFVPPRPKDSLVAFVAAVNKIFLANELCLQHDTLRNDKIHATLMNSKFRAKKDSVGSSEGGGSSVGEKAPRVPFDARRALELFGEPSQGGSNFGDYFVHRLELSRMNPSTAKGDGEDHSSSRKRMNYYACEDFVEF